MNLSQTGLLPKKRDTRKLTGGIIDQNSMFDNGFNVAIDQISQIPFDPVKYVEVDEEELSKLIQECVHLGSCIYYPNCHEHQDFIVALLQSKSKWLIPVKPQGEK